MKIRLTLVAFAMLVLSGCGEPKPVQPAAPASPSAQPFTEEGEIGVVKPEDQGYKMGMPVDVGGWTITVKSFKCGLTEIPSRDGGKSGDYPATKPTEDGEFCRVKAKVKNTGKSPSVMSAQNQFGWGEDVQYGMSMDFNTDQNNTEAFIAYQANPNQVGTGEMWFEIAKGTTLTDLEIHGADVYGIGTLIKLVP